MIPCARGCGACVRFVGFIHTIPQVAAAVAPLRGLVHSLVTQARGCGRLGWKVLVGYAPEQGVALKFDVSAAVEVGIRSVEETAGFAEMPLRRPE